MLEILGKQIEKRPWLVIGIILMITIGASIFVPFLDMGTSTEDFLPDDEIVKANERITKYFGDVDQLLLIFVQKQNAESTITPEALKEEFKILKELEKIDKVSSSIAIANYADILCFIEFNKTILECSNEEINIVLNDLFFEKTFDEIKMLISDDPNEEVDFNPYPRLTKGKSIDSIDLKNYYIQEKEDKICFSIEVYDLSHFESKLSPPHLKMNVIEWFIEFKNLITPDERLEINYKIAAHIEPKNNIWEIGKGIIPNFKDIISCIKNKELLRTYKKETFLWIQNPGKDMFFPIRLQSGNITFNNEINRIEIEVDKKELSKFGIAPEIFGSTLPARLGNTKAGFRFYQTPNLKLPWLRVDFETDYLRQYFTKIQNRPILSSISEKVLSKFGEFTWEDFEKLFELMEGQGFSVEKIALKDMESWWIETDKSPDEGVSDNTFFIKPFYIEELENKAVVFLSEDYKNNFKPSGTLMLLLINESVGPMQSGEISRYIVEEMEKIDEKENHVSLKATGSGVISYQIDDLTEEANMIILPSIIIAICIILFLNFRMISYVILPLLGLSISVVWLIGTMVLLGIRFNTMYVALIPLLMGLGVDYSVHMFHNYRAEIERGNSPGGAIANSIKDVGTAMFLAALTTVIAFLSFLSASIPPLREFGVLCALGIIYTFFITITLQAALRYVLDRRKNAFEKLKQKKNYASSFMRKTSKKFAKYSKVFLIVACFVTIGMFVGATNVETGFDMEDFLPEENPAIELWSDIYDNFPFSSQNQEFILIEGDVNSVATLKGISNTNEKIQDDEFVAKKPDGEIKVVSTLSIIQKAIKENNTIATKFNLNQKGLPRNDNDVKRLYDYLYDESKYWLEIREVLHRNKNSYDATVIRVYIDFSKSDIDHADKLEILYNDLNNDLSDYGDTNAIVTGSASGSYVITNELTASQIMSTALSILLAAIVLIIAYRSPLLGLITISPVAISIIWILGSINFLGYSLNVMTVMVTSLTIGIGIDYAIHATGRFRLVADKTGDSLKAMTETIGHTGSALMIAAISTIAGFGMLIFAPIPPEQQFGVIMCLTILYALLTSIFILPYIIMKWGKWRKKQKGYIISRKKQNKK